jgi:hypothetical protein
MGTKTKIRDGAEDFGEEFFRARRDHNGAILICGLFNDEVESGILPGDLEYKSCLLDLTLTGKLWQRFMDAAQIFWTTGFCSTPP